MICGLLSGNRFPFFVGVARLELTTSWSQTRHTTKLYYTPKILFLLKNAFQLNRVSYLISALPNFAERGGFEPPVQSPVRQFSKLLVSATHPSLLRFWVVQM